MGIGEKIKERREKQGIKQVELAESACISPQMMNQIEHGVKMPSVPVLLLIAQKLECSVEDLTP